MIIAQLRLGTTKNQTSLCRSSIACIEQFLNTIIEHQGKKGARRCWLFYSIILTVRCWFVFVYKQWPYCSYPKAGQKIDKCFIIRRHGKIDRRVALHMAFLSVLLRTSEHFLIYSYVQCPIDFLSFTLSTIAIFILCITAFMNNDFILQFFLRIKHSNPI